MSDLRSVVLDYLVHMGYSSTARTFAQSSMVPTLDGDGDLVMGSPDPLAALLTDESLLQVDLRQRIRTHILGGEINDAIELIEQHFPSVLSAEPIPSTSKPHKYITGTEFVASSTVNPAHLNLNLRILAFTEAFRTAYLDRGELSLDHEDDRHVTDLLAKLTKLNNLVNILPLPERAIFFDEIMNVSGLLAFPDVRTSPVARYLSQERREAVAIQINTAILYRMGHPAISHLELSTRYTSTLLSFLCDLQIPAPGQKEGKGTGEHPRFDLGQFLHSRA
ncbi:lish motif-containing protein [Mycena amicta]|nr:lish motif-containing protein [Mycena amicta]